MTTLSRVMLAAAHKSSGKTVVTSGLCRALADRGHRVQPFKKGPDYIDPMWLGRAAGAPCYNLDFNTMDADELASFFASRTSPDKLAIVEANKGLFDGVSEDGSDSNAGLAVALGLPVVLVIDTNGMTRGIAPLLQGYVGFDADVNIAGVILNKTGGSRHEAKLRRAVETHTDLPVLGAIGRDARLEIGERHLGLTTPAEDVGGLEARLHDFAQIAGAGVDLNRLAAIAGRAGDLAARSLPAATARFDGMRVAIARDRAFGFYYEDDLETFAALGATLVPFDATTDTTLPDTIDALFIGGGFPELALDDLAANTGLLRDIRTKLEAGLPAYAECGGLMYLSRSITWKGRTADMVGFLPMDTDMHARPQGRGYTAFTALPAHPWLTAGTRVQAHEFHYARARGVPAGATFTRAIERGHGTTGNHDGILVGNALAGFCHLRNSPKQPWIEGFLDFARTANRADAT